MFVVNREFSDELTSLMPEVRHGICDASCTGRIAAFVEDCDVELRCNLCGATLGVIQVNVMEGLLGLECDDEPAKSACDQCPRSDEESCRWYTFEDEEPIAVACCICGRHPDVDDDGVTCLCGRRSRVRARGLIAAIQTWNHMVEPAS